MATFLTKIQKNTSSFKANIKDHMALIDEMRSLEKRTIEKSEQRKPRFRERGQLTPRKGSLHFLIQVCLFWNFLILQVI